MAEDEPVPFWWVVLFLALTLGAGAIAVTSVGGSLIAGFALPFLF
ncbi:hypothetical protein [Haloprofundus marisrubri]|nr:hypothetical protein [Haloprofundus marisrubri]